MCEGSNDEKQEEQVQSGSLVRVGVAVVSRYISRAHRQSSLRFSDNIQDVNCQFKLLFLWKFISLIGSEVLKSIVCM